MNPALWAIRKKVFVLIMCLFILIGGAGSFMNLGWLEDPEFTIKQALVFTNYPGASPREVEEEVSEVLESAVQQMPQLKRVESESWRGLSILKVHIKDEYQKEDLPQVWDELRRKVNDSRAELPPGAGPSLVRDDFGDVFGIYLALYGEGFSYAELKEHADYLRKELLLVPDVAKVELSAIQPEMVYVEASNSKLARLGISPEVIMQVLQQKNLARDSGKVRAGPEYIPIHPTGEFKSVEEIGELLIGGAPPNLIRLGDVAEVKRGYRDPSQNILTYNGFPAIGIGISIVSGGNVVELGEAVKKRLAELEPSTPAGLELGVISFQADLVSKAVNGFMLNLVEAVVIVIVVLLFTMGLRSGLIMGLVLLLTICATFIVMDAWSINLQRISLGALILALGMLVDNAIVVTEGILIKISQGIPKKQAAADTVKRTSMPLLGATFVAILAFAAIGLSDNSTGEFCLSLYQVILISLGASWVLAMTVTPLLCVMFLKPAGANSGADPYSGFVYRFYKRFLEMCLRRRGLTCLVMMLLLGATVFGMGHVKKSFFPKSTRPIFMVNMWMPQGTHIEQTSAALEKVRKFIKNMDGVKNITTFAGQGGLRFTLVMDPQLPNPAYGQLLVEVQDYRAIPGYFGPIKEFAAENAPSAQCLVKKFQIGPGADSKIKVRFDGPDPSQLRMLADKAMAVMRGDPNAKHIRSYWRQRTKTLKPVISEARARRAGLTRQQLTQTLGMTFSGVQAGVYREGDELLPIVLRAPQEERNDAGSFDLMHIWNPAAGKMTPVRQFITHVETRWEDPLIERRNRKRTITVGCDPVSGTADALFQKLRPLIEAIETPPGYGLEWGGEYEDSNDANEQLFKNIPVTFLMMVLTVILLFNSVRQPLIIFLCLPLALIGVTGGLLASGLPMGFMALLGVLSLSGMLIKNAVVLLDQINLELSEGKAPWKAVVDASVSRVRPVTMAALTTVLGMTPLLFDDFFNAMAMAIMAGLTFGTLLTLIVVPVLYALFFRVGRADAARDLGADQTAG